MLRVLGTFGLGLLFLAVSAPLRSSLMGGLDSLGKTIELYSPLSYVVLAVLTLAGMMFWLYRSSQPR
jgi:hypothetical protein